MSTRRNARRDLHGRGHSLKRASACSLALGLAISLAAPAFGEELPEHFIPVRPNGMGGAFTAISNDENAIWTNPAGIARVRKARSRSTVNKILFPALSVGANTKSRIFIQGIQQHQSDQNLDSLVGKADQLGDKPFWSVISLAPVAMFDLGSTPAALGGYLQTTIKAVVDKDNPTQAKTQAVSDVGALAGLSFTNNSNRLNAGVILRSVRRYAYEDSLPITALSDRSEMQKRFKDDANRSSALAVDAGFMWTMADFWFPTLGVAVLDAPTGCKKDYLNPFSKVRENVCGTVFHGSFSNPDAISTVDPTDLRVGFSITPRLHRKLGMRLSVDAHHLYVVSGSQRYGLSGVDPRKQLHVGAELFTGNPLTPSPFSVSVGLSQGYYTMGASLRLGFLSLDFATFGRDISTNATPVEDRRVMVGLSGDF